MTQDKSIPTSCADSMKPCPFCGHVGLDFSEGSTFRWRIAECSECGATTGEERIQTTGAGTQEEWEANCRQRLVEAWNRRAAMSAPAGEAPNLWPVIQWLEGGCDPLQAAKELRIYAARIATGQSPAAPSQPSDNPTVIEWMEQPPEVVAAVHARFVESLADAELLARAFHETYERLAPGFGYETRKETREFDPASPNGRLMIAVCRDLLFRGAAAHPQPAQASAPMQSAPADSVRDVMAEVMLRACAVEAAGARRGRDNRAPSDHEPEINALVMYVDAALRAALASPPPSASMKEIPANTSGVQGPTAAATSDVVSAQFEQHVAVNPCPPGQCVPWRWRGGKLGACVHCGAKPCDYCDGDGGCVSIDPAGWTPCPKCNGTGNGGVEVWRDPDTGKVVPKPAPLSVDRVNANIQAAIDASRSRQERGMEPTPDAGVDAARQPQGEDRG